MRPVDDPHGWKIWQQALFGAGWYAVPAPSGTTLPDVFFLPNRIGPHVTAAEAAGECVKRYGWYDDCPECGGGTSTAVMARRCQHRRPLTH